MKIKLKLKTENESELKTKNFEKAQEIVKDYSISMSQRGRKLEEEKKEGLMLPRMTQKYEAAVRNLVLDRN